MAAEPAAADRLDGFGLVRRVHGRDPVGNRAAHIGGVVDGARGGRRRDRRRRVVADHFRLDRGPNLAGRAHDGDDGLRRGRRLVEPVSTRDCTSQSTLRCRCYGFGSTETPAFGSTVTPAFGSTETPAFGSTET